MVGGRRRVHVDGEADWGAAALVEIGVEAGGVLVVRGRAAEEERAAVAGEGRHGGGN